MPKTESVKETAAETAESVGKKDIISQIESIKLSRTKNLPYKFICEYQGEEYSSLEELRDPRAFDDYLLLLNTLLNHPLGCRFVGADITYLNILFEYVAQAYNVHEDTQRVTPREFYDINIAVAVLDKILNELDELLKEDMKIDSLSFGLIFEQFCEAARVDPTFLEASQEEIDSAAAVETRNDVNIQDAATRADVAARNGSPLSGTATKAPDAAVDSGVDFKSPSS